MKSLTQLFALSVLALAMAACGGNTDQLEAKKAQLVELQAERAKLDKKISDLETEIATLDPGSSKEGAAIPVKVVAVEPHNLEHFIKVQGQVEARNSIMVSPKMGGTYTHVYVTEGMNVSKGQVLAKVDDAVMVKSLDELKVQLSLATSLYNKQKNLWDQKIGSEVQLMQAQTQKEALEQRIATTQEQIAMSKVVAPISGVVEMVMGKPGEGAIPGMPVCRLVSLTDLTFKANLSESHLPYLKKGDQVSIHFPSLAKSLEAKVHSIGQTINPSNRTVSVMVELPANSTDLKANLIGEISIKDATREQAIAIPQEYLQKGVSGSFVMVAEKDSTGAGHVARRMAVTTGLKTDTEVEILTGLSKGQLLITDGTVTDGEKVSLTQPATQK